MTAISIASTGIREVFTTKNDVFDMIATEAITKGQVVYQTSAGKAGIADANAAGKQQARGIALKTVAAGKPCPILRRGYVAGFDLSGLDYDAPVFLSDTAGSLDTAAGTLSVNCGRVISMNDPDLSKILFVDFDHLRTWA